MFYSEDNWRLNEWDREMWGCTAALGPVTTPACCSITFIKCIVVERMFIKWFKWRLVQTFYLFCWQGNKRRSCAGTPHQIQSVDLCWDWNIHQTAVAMETHFSEGLCNGPKMVPMTRQVNNQQHIKVEWKEKMEASANCHTHRTYFLFLIIISGCFVGFLVLIFLNQVCSRI